MFAKACQKAYRFTRPLIVNTRSVDGTVSSSLGTFFVVNPEGWVLTAGHLFDSYMQFRQDQTKIKGVEEINAKAPAGTEKVKLDPKWLTNHSFWWGWDGVRLADVYVNREIDVCLGRLEGFKPDMVSEYPVFRDPETMLPGTSICRTGFPFTNVAADFDEKCNAFRIRPGVLPIAFFPNIFREIVSYMPFAGLSQNPVLILMMKYDYLECGKVLLISFGWLILLELLAKLLFNHAIKIVTVQGG